MADFAIWMRAAEHSLGWAPGAFDAAYTQKQSVAAELELEASPIANPIRTLVKKHHGHWTGTATALLHALDIDREYEPQPLGWPKSPRALSDRLMRDAGALREVGINVERGHSGSRTITLDAVDAKAAA
jgi:putative DNA primase/helicase